MNSDFNVRNDNKIIKINFKDHYKIRTMHITKGITIDLITLITETTGDKETLRLILILEGINDNNYSYNRKNNTYQSYITGAQGYKT